MNALENKLAASLISNKLQAEVMGYIRSQHAEIERLTVERDVNKRMRDQHFADLNLYKAMRESDDAENAALRTALEAAQKSVDTRA